MNYTAIVTQEDLFLDDQKKPVISGKIEFVDPGTNNLINVYTYEEETIGSFVYVIAENPIYTDIHGRPEHTYFTTQLTLCKLYKYIGNFSDPLVDDDTNNWELIRQWYANMSNEDEKQETTVTTINDLRNTDPSVQKVTVTGYRTAYDCEARTYIWDDNATDPQDGGYIIGSNLTSRGRWILLFDGEYIPSSYYGVYPGNETNMNALLEYPANVGSNRWPTAPGIYFINGVYTVGGLLTTGKRIQVDRQTSFSNRSSITCKSLDVIGGKGTYIIGDFIFSDPNQVAHSSWFKTITGWVNSNANTLVFDKYNPSLQQTITGELLIQNKRIIADKPIYFYCNRNSWVTIDNCIIENDYSFAYTNNTYIYFKNMEYKDTWFSDSTENRVDVSNSNYNNMFTNDGTALTDHHKHVLLDSTVPVLLKNFKNTGFYYRAALDAKATTVFDFEGRKLDVYFGIVNGNYSNTVFTRNFGSLSGSMELTNAIFTNCSTMSGQQIGLMMNGVCTYTLDNSSIPIYGNNAAEGSILRIVNNSTVNSYISGWLNARTTAIYGENSTFGLSIKMKQITGSNVSDETQYAINPGVSLGNCVYVNGHNIATNNITLTSCTLMGNIVELYPCFYNGEPGILTAINDNRIYGTTKFTYTKFEWNYHETKMVNMTPHVWSFMNNRFMGTDPYGLYMPYVSWPTMEYTDNRFIDYDKFSKMLLKNYKGNTTYGTLIPSWDNALGYNYSFDNEYLPSLWGKGDPIRIPVYAHPSGFTPDNDTVTAMRYNINGGDIKSSPCYLRSSYFIDWTRFNDSGAAVEQCGDFFSVFPLIGDRTGDITQEYIVTLKPTNML